MSTHRWATPLLACVFALVAVLAVAADVGAVDCDTLTSDMPSSALAGDPATPVTLFGTFLSSTPGDVLLFQTSFTTVPLTPTFQSATQIIVVVPASALTRPSPAAFVFLRQMCPPASIAFTILPVLNADGVRLGDPWKTSNPAGGDQTFIPHPGQFTTFAFYDRNSRISSPNYNFTSEQRLDCTTLGRRTDQCSYDPLNRPTKQTFDDLRGLDSPTVYDAAGNLIQGGLRPLSYDVLNALKRLELTELGSGGVLRVDPVKNSYVRTASGITFVIPTRDDIVGGRSYPSSGWSTLAEDQLPFFKEQHGWPGHLLGGWANAAAYLLTNAFTGSLFMAQTDGVISGVRVPLGLTRVYNSKDKSGGLLGLGWWSNYFISIQNTGPGTAMLKAGDGQELRLEDHDGMAVFLDHGVFDSAVLTMDGLNVTSPDQTQFNFDPFGLLKNITDPHGNPQTFTRDTQDRVASITDIGSGQGLLLTYDTSTLIEVATTGTATMATQAPSTPLVSYAYTSGLLTSATNANGDSWRYGYDANNLLNSITDPNGNVTYTITYDAAGRVAQIRNALGDLTTYQYDTPVPGTTRVTDARGNVREYVHDSQGRLTAVRNALGGVATWAYTPNNLVESFSDQAGNVSRFTYDERGNALSDTDPIGNTATRTFDVKNNVLTYTDRKGATTTFTYDGVNNLVQAMDPLGGASTFTYNPAGQPLSLTDPLNITERRSYDTQGNLTTITQAAGTVDERTWNLGYSPRGFVTQSTDPRGVVTTYGRDALDRITQITEAVGTPRERRTTVAFDRDGNVTSLTNPLGSTWGYDYDAMSRLIRKRSPLGDAFTLAYDSNGNVSSTTDGNGMTNAYIFDALNRPTQATLSDGSVTAITYDAIGNPVSIRRFGNVTTFAYDALIRTTRQDTPDGSTVQIAYDAESNRTSMTYPSGKTATYAYDALNRLTSAVGPEGDRTDLQYDANSRLLQRTYSNSASSGYTRNSLGAIASVVNRVMDTVLSSATYQRDALGNPIQVTSETGDVTSYAYDELGRLTQWVAPSGDVTTYTYDPANNRIAVAAPSGTTTSTYDGANRLTMVGATSLTNDRNGNLISDGTLRYEYDGLNRLVRARNLADTLIAQYTYDGLGRRVRQEVAGGVYQYVPSPLGASVLTESGPDGDITYFRAGGLSSATTTTLKLFYHPDAKGSTMTVTDANGALSENYEYDAWGQPVMPVDPLGNGNKYRFAGEAQDPVTGFIFFGGRSFYNPDTGRFISGDNFNPLNPYPYQGSNPVLP